MDIIESFPFIDGYRIYKCKPGYKFYDGTVTRTVMCVYGGVILGAVWHAKIEHCKGIEIM